MNKLFKIRLYTGPCGVADMAERLRTAGYNVVCEGTEHVHFEAFDRNDGWGAIGTMALVEDDLKIKIDALAWSLLSKSEATS